MNEPKQHHYIPDKFQLQFGDEEGRWWFFNRLRPERGIQRGTPGALFRKNRLYSVTDADGRRSAPFETETSKIEGRANVLIERIVAAARAGRTPGLTAGERRTWDRYFLLQWRRVPDKIVLKSQPIFSSFPPVSGLTMPPSRPILSTWTRPAARLSVG